MYTKENPQTFAAKLRQIGYREPVLPPSQPATIPARPCVVKNCDTQIPAGDTSAMCAAHREETEAIDRFMRKQEEYLRVRAERPALRSRVRAFLSFAWGPLTLIFFVALTTLLCVTCARAVDVPDRIIAAIGDVRGKWTRGSIGEIVPWQISPAVLRDLGATHKANRAHRDPVLAESLTRAWLAHLYRATGDWRQAVAAYHAGLAGRDRPHGREYSARVFNLVLQ
jgi:hypothetical protein